LASPPSMKYDLIRFDVPLEIAKHAFGIMPLVDDNVVNASCPEPLPGFIMVWLAPSVPFGSVKCMSAFLDLSSFAPIADDARTRNHPEIVRGIHGQPVCSFRIRHYPLPR